MKTFTPKIGIMVIVLVLVLSAVLMVSKRNDSTSLSSSASQSPGSPTLAAKAEKSDGPSIGDYYAGPSLPPSSTSSATPIPKPPALKVYIYPSAKTISSTATKLELESSASSEDITKWYKEKIDELKFNAKSFSQVNTNGNVLNKFSVARPGEKLIITIKKDQNASKVSITVDRL